MKLTPREIIISVAGLILGLVVGVLLEAETDLFGTAGGDTRSTDFTYYLIELDQTEKWLAATYPESTETFQASIGVLEQLPGLWSTLPPVDTLKEDVDVILPPVYAALQGVEEEDVAEYKVAPDTEITACLGVDDNPYDGAVMYLYVTIPDDDMDSLEIPEAWEDFEIKRPKTNTMYWKLVECYPYAEEEAE
ncbi:MAG: hypothetical protein K8S97_16040 [Anaerolineae bacterium]|nr:hypothetical protein [Anaerolineae bacterium]